MYLPAKQKNIPLSFRGVQLDLARQMENIEYIKSFIDFISKYGYTHLVMYVEGRIKTKSFPHERPGGSYSPEEIREVVSYAASRNIEVMPVVSALGHADIFLAMPELEHLAELRGGCQGRFSKAKHVFCPSIKETNEFLERYLTEIAELFPCEYFHTGFDEAWDIGYCDLCRKRLADERQSGIFAKQIIDMHKVVSKKLGKRMVIWDDMFDMYPDVLDTLPRDIILCAWHYDKLIEKPYGHCGGPQHDKFKQYDQMGFEYWFAPATFSLRNVLTLTEYARTGTPTGALLTSWCMERDFLYAEYPVIAYAGKIWSSDTDSCPDKVFSETTRCMKVEQLALLEKILGDRSLTLRNDFRTYLCGPLSNSEYDAKLFNGAAFAILEQHAQTLNTDDKSFPVIEEVLVRLEIEAAYFALRETLPSWFNPKAPGACRTEFDLLKQKLLKLKQKRHEQWGKYRKGITPCRSDIYFDSLLEMLENAETKSYEVKAFLNVTFPKKTSGIRFLAKYLESDEWEELASGAPRVNVDYCSQQAGYPVYTEKIPEKIRIESSGYVGCGITYINYATASAVFVPDRIIEVYGKVFNPEGIIENGRDFCFLGEGEQAAREKFRNPELSKKIDSLEISLKEL